MGQAPRRVLLRSPKTPWSGHGLNHRHQGGRSCRCGVPRMSGHARQTSRKSLRGPSLPLGSAKGRRPALGPTLNLSALNVSGRSLEISDVLKGDS
jgi:hypothetical protein